MNIRQKSKKITVQNEEILLFHVYLLMNKNPAIAYADFLNRVTNNWKKEFTVFELDRHANEPLRKKQHDNG